MNTREVRRGVWSCATLFLASVLLVLLAAVSPLNSGTGRPGERPGSIGAEPDPLPLVPPELQCDLGDAPDSHNSFGVPMTAYPGVPAHYPTVYKPGSSPSGPIHWLPRAVAYLGDKPPSLEYEADTGRDEDTVNNIDPNDDIANLDLDPNGVKMPLVLPDCQLAKLDLQITVPPGALQPPQLYVNVWFDWNRDGDWDDTVACPAIGPQDLGMGAAAPPASVDAPEWAVQNQELTFTAPGLYTVTTPLFRCSQKPLSVGADPNALWMRITLSEQKWLPSWGPGGSGPADGYLYGTTEDYYLVDLGRWSFYPSFRIPQAPPKPTPTLCEGGSCLTALGGRVSKTPPYDIADGSTRTVVIDWLGRAEADWYAPARDPKGTVGAMAKAIGLASANAWAGQGFYYTMPVDGDLTVEFDMTYYGVDFGFGLGAAFHTIHSVLWMDSTCEEDLLGGGVDVSGSVPNLIENATAFTAALRDLLLQYMQLDPQRHTMKRTFHLSAHRTVRILCGGGVKVSAAGGITSAARMVGEVTSIRVSPPAQPPNTPSTPSGPTSGIVGVSYSYSTSATDPDGDQVFYTFDWGDGTAATRAPASGYVNSGTAASASHSWAAPGRYLVKAKATDSRSASSPAWSSPLTVDIVTPHPPNTPATPSGPTSGTAGVSYSYSTSATDPDGDQVKYTFNWGDGQQTTTSLFNSGTTASVSHVWTAAGTYLVKAGATDSRGLTSGWSSSLSVVIATVSRPPNTPATPSGPTSGTTGVSYSYSTSTTDPDGDQVFYTFEWSDVTAQTRAPASGYVNSGAAASVSRSWATAGTYSVKAKATDSKGLVSGWSSPLTVVITAPASAATIDFPHYHSFIVEIARPVLSKAGWIFARENDNVIVGSTLVGSRLADIGNSTKDTLLSIAGVGGVRDAGIPGAYKLEIYSTSSVVEWSLWYSPNSYSSGYVDIGKVATIDFPHYHSFIVEIGRPISGKAGWIFARENDDVIVGSTLVGSRLADISNSTKDTLLSIADLGGVRDTGTAGVRKLEIYTTTSDVVEWSLWYGPNSYSSGYTSPGSPSTIDFPHYHSFVVEISRPVRNKAGWVFARENDNVIVGSTLVGGRLADLSNATKDTLLSVTGLGGVRDTGTPGARKLEVYTTTSNVTEWSLWYGPDSYSSGYVSP